MISHDSGKTWEDEVYYMYHGKGYSGFNRNVVLDDGTIVTLCGTCDNLEAKVSWAAMVGCSDHTIIRWKRPLSEGRSGRS